MSSDSMQTSGVENMFEFDNNNSNSQIDFDSLLLSPEMNFYNNQNQNTVQESFDQDFSSFYQQDMSQSQMSPLMQQSVMQPSYLQANPYQSTDTYMQEGMDPLEEMLSQHDVMSPPMTPGDFDQNDVSGTRRGRPRKNMMIPSPPLTLRVPHPSLGRPIIYTKTAGGLQPLMNMANGSMNPLNFGMPPNGYFNGIQGLTPNLLQQNGGSSSIPTRVPGPTTPSLVNVVAVVNLKCKIDLKHVALAARNAEYNPKRFRAVIMRIRESRPAPTQGEAREQRRRGDSDRATALIFSSGKMVVTGANSVEKARLAGRKFARIIQKLGYDASFNDFKVPNMTASVDIRHPVSLEKLAADHVRFCTYEPELFGGLVYRMQSPKLVILVFSSGKLVFTGAREKEEIDFAFEKIVPVLKECQRIVHDNKPVQPSSSHSISTFNS